MTDGFDGRLGDDGAVDRENQVLDVVAAERTQLLQLAYRLLGTAADAEDVLQETYVRWYSLTPSQRDAIVSPGAWLTTVTSRICLDVLGSARSRRERYVGEWLPEPVPGGVEPLYPGASAVPLDPADHVGLDESLHMAFLVVLDSMTPAERVSFVLHDVFRYPFAEVAAIVGRSSQACRQLATSARRRLRDARPATDRPQNLSLVREFKDAWTAHDIDALVALLDPDATAIADGGGRVPAQVSPVVGARDIAETLIAIATGHPDFHLVERTVNGQPGLIGLEQGVTSTVIAFNAGDVIRTIWVVRNPDKLTQWRP